MKKKTVRYFYGKGPKAMKLISKNEIMKMIEELPENK